MRRKAFIGLLIASVWNARSLAASEPNKICRDCKREINPGDTLAPVQDKDGIYFIHFKCALKKHLRQFKD